MKYAKLIILLIICSTTYGQIEANKLSKEFFTTENTKLAISLGGDLTPVGDSGQTVLITPNGNIDKNQLSFATPNASFSLGFDIYSQQSKLGFLIDPTYNLQNYSIQETNAPLRDSISISNLELPIYLKLRLGNPLSKSQFYWAVGGGYSIPLNVEQNYFDVTTNSLVATIEEKQMFKPLPYLSTIIGYELNLAFGESDKEIYERDGIKMLFFAKANYDLGNRINENYNFGINTSLGSISEPNLRFLRISFGIKFLLRVSKVVDLAKDISQNKTN